jgi:hypothetical protein
MYFNDLIVTIPFRKELKMDGTVYINSGILFYFGFTLFLFLMEGFMEKGTEPDLMRLIWSFNNVSNIIKNVLITIGLGFYSHAVPVGQWTER